MSKAIVWFRNDLRIKDNEALWKACQNGNEVYPVYVFDPRYFGTTTLGFERIGSFRAQFLLESLEGLKSNLQKIGGDLIIRHGKCEKVIAELVDTLKIDQVYCGKEVAHEEQQMADKLEEELIKKGISLIQCWQSAMYHEQDVPWPIKQVPDVFTSFRKESEKTVEVREEFKAPTAINYPGNVDPGVLPELCAFRLPNEKRHKNAVLDFKGGEKQAWKRLNDYFWKDDLLKTYKNTRNELIGKNYSSKFSPWLALGCISAKSVYHEIKRYEQERVKNSSTYWLFFELLWRDFFKFMTKKHGKSIFLLTGITGDAPHMEDNLESFERWRRGETGEYFVDANMTELNETGYMSNRGRQNVASYLVHDLKVNWTWGAMWYENRLVDYDPSSNWLNWAYIAGVGNDPQKGRKFILENQALKYDPQGEYAKLWLKTVHK
ncbi:DASH family cryptochrome [Fulvivirga sp. M361]|uniref:DASH family cryptochrome n=1 Tax=Fulvivirga sp. M361 TaxID=2594266 RepID=UPI00117B3B2B|nr:DASH family cryptochrome [Fulvivirga sp. M361]TRX61398.1 DASH family cryptochrome [Fulvivirga sp. M361]